jgi:ribulose-5-phosphate 4-epimerase/fuculose-1-phosphate aldolase
VAVSVDELRERAATAHRILALTGSMNDTTGHVFVRVPGSDEFLARCRNPHDWSPRYVEPDAMRRADFSGKATEDLNQGTLPPERYIATELFKSRPEINCVIHAHPPAQVLCSNMEVPLLPIVGSQNWGGALMAAKGVPVYPRSLLIHTPDLGRNVATLIGKRAVLLLKHHGNVVVGRSIEEATVRCIEIENLARLCWQIAQSGRTPPPIPFEDLEDQAAMSLRTTGEGGPLRKWRYYEQLLQHEGRIDAKVEAVELVTV